MAICFFLNSLLKYFSTSAYMLHCTNNIHTKMISNLLRAVVNYFDVTPSGFILNTFSSDVGIIDTMIFKQFFESLEKCISLIVLMITLITISYWLAIIIFVLLLGIIIILYYCLPVFDTCRSIELDHKGPVFDVFNTTL